jgi:hypothetical protein
MDEKQFERMIAALTEIADQIEGLRKDADRRAAKVVQGVRRAHTDRVSTGGSR